MEVWRARTKSMQKQYVYSLHLPVITDWSLKYKYISRSFRHFPNSFVAFEIKAQRPTKIGGISIFCHLIWDFLGPKKKEFLCWYSE